MSELRRDPIVDRWVIIAPERPQRRDEVPARGEPRESAPPGVCAFCPGNEAKTPRELLARRPHTGPAATRDAPGWSLRVFPNRQPVLRIEGGLDASAHGLYDHMSGVGAHEVVVETPDHARRLAD